MERSRSQVRRARNQRLIFAGACRPSTRRPSSAPNSSRSSECPNCSEPTTYYLFKKDKSHELIAGPEFTEKDLFIDADRQKTRRDVGDSDQGPAGDHRRLRKAAEPDGETIDGRARLVRDQGRTRRSRAPKSPARSRKSAKAGDRTSPSASPIRPRSLPGRHPAHRPARSGTGDRPLRRRRSRSALGPFRGRPRQRSQDAADHQLRRKPGRDRRPHRRPDLGRLQQHRRSAGPGLVPAARRPADQPEADQREPGLGDARQPGAPRRDQGRDHRPRPGRPLPAPLLPGARA